MRPRPTQTRRQRERRGRVSDVPGYFIIQPPPEDDFVTMEELDQKVVAAYDGILAERVNLRDPKVQWLLGKYTVDLLAVAQALSEMLTDVDDGDLTYHEYLINAKSIMAVLVLRCFEDGRKDADLNHWRFQLEEEDATQDDV